MKTLAVIAICVAPFLSIHPAAAQQTYKDCRNSSISPGQSICCEIIAPAIHEIPFNAPGGVGATGKIMLTPVTSWPRPQLWTVNSNSSSTVLRIAGGGQVVSTNQSKTWTYTVLKSSSQYKIAVQNRTTGANGKPFRYIIGVDTTNTTCAPAAFIKTNARLCITDADSGLGQDRYIEGPDGTVKEADADGCATFENLDDLDGLSFKANK